MFFNDFFNLILVCKDIELSHGTTRARGVCKDIELSYGRTRARGFFTTTGIASLNLYMLSINLLKHLFIKFSGQPFFKNMF